MKHFAKYEYVLLVDLTREKRRTGAGTNGSQFYPSYLHKRDPKLCQHMMMCQNIHFIRYLTNI